MKISMKKSIGSLVVLAALCVGMAAEAGSIPTNRVPLHTYAYRKAYCYLQPGGTQKGWIDAGDYVIVTQIRSDGWAYGSYPVGKSRVSKWFKANDLIANVGYINQNKCAPTNTTNVYRNASLKNSMGSVSKNEPLLVVSNSGDSRQFIYKLDNGTGYKMGWMPYWDFKNPVAPPPINVNTQVVQKLNSLKNTNGYKVGTRYTGTGQCRGFANKVYTSLFKGVNSITGYTSNNFGATSYSGSYVVGSLSNIGSDGAPAVKNLFSKAKPGAFVQMGRRYSLNSSRTAPAPHSAIIYNIYSDGVDFYEANTDGKNTIKVNKYTWAKLADRNKGFTIYMPKNYVLK